MTPQENEALLARPQTEPAELAGLDWRAAFMLLLATACLTIVHYHGNPLGLDERYRLFSWHILNFLVLFIVPVLVIRFVFKEPVREYGLQKGEARLWGKWLLLLLALFIPIAAIASRLPDFAHFYPRYRPLVMPHRPLLGGPGMMPADPRLIGLSMAGWLVYFWAWEFFFRGFLLFGLGKRIGPLAIFVQMMPFVMAHFPKLELETWAAIFAGIVLGIMAWQSKSFLGPWLLHWLAATSMDVFVVFWPLRPFS